MRLIRTALIVRTLLNVPLELWDNLASVRNIFHLVPSRLLSTLTFGKILRNLLLIQAYANFTSDHINISYYNLVLSIT